MSEARQEILRLLRRREAGAAHPAERLRPRTFPDLVERFVLALQAAHGEAFVEDGGKAAVGRLQQLLVELAARRIVCQDEPPLDSLDLAGTLTGFEWHIAGRTTGSLRALCNEADVGVSSAVAALAETGTVIVASGPGRSRLVTLLPPVHAVLLPASRLLPDLFAWVSQQERPLPANVTLISGPSKTADIEQTLEVGVHGPRRLVVIIYESQEDSARRAG
jgi:L-lactate utilization protein LutC